MFGVLLEGWGKLLEEDLLEKRSVGKYSIPELRNTEQVCHLLYRRVRCCVVLLQRVCYRYTDYFALGSVQC